MKKAVADYASAIRKFRQDPALFVEALYNTKPDKWQEDVMRAVGRGDRRITIRSGRRVGKTTLMAWLSQWFLMTRRDAKVIVTAPSAGQLQDAFIPEFRKQRNCLPPDLRELWELKQDRFEFRLAPDQPFENFVTIRTARPEQPETLQGINAPNVLVLVDEAAGVQNQNFDALSGSLGSDNAHIVLTGNPNRDTGYFADTHKRFDGWTKFHVSSEDCDRVSREWIAEMETRYSGRESNAFRIHVLGDFPEGDDDTVIPLPLIEAARTRDVLVSPVASVVWGIDVARFGSDRSALCKRKGNAVTQRIMRWRNLDLMQLTGAIKAEYDASSPQDRPQEMLVDVIGLGAGVVDRLRELGLPARGINVSESPALGDKYAKLRDELWFKAREWLERRDCLLPLDDELCEELATVRFGYTSSGKQKVEGKDDLRKRGVPSPDLADAFVLTFASVAGTALHGRHKHNKPIRRNIAGII